MRIAPLVLLPRKNLARRGAEHDVCEHFSVLQRNFNTASCLLHVDRFIPGLVICSWFMLERDVSGHEHVLYVLNGSRGSRSRQSSGAGIGRDGPVGSVSEPFVQGFDSSSMGALTADQKRHLATLSTDLRFQLAQAEVTPVNQARLGELGIRTLVLFAGLDESRERVRAALASELPLDVQASLANRLEMARLISAWEASKLHLEVNEKNRAESRLGTQNRLVQPSEQHSMRVAVEAVLGSLKDKEVPSRSFLATKLEQIEANQPAVECLTEVASLEDSELEMYSAVIDPATNVLKIKTGKTLTSTPQSPEELRLRHRRIGLAWDMLATKHSNRNWLSKNMTDTFRRFSDYVLGQQVAGLMAGDGRRPTWNLVLQFEHEARKAAYKWLRDGEVTDLEAAFKRATTDTEVLQRYLVIPFSLNITAASVVQVDVPPPSAAGSPPRARGRGRGRGRSGVRTQPKDSQQTKGKALRTPDGQPLCWRYNRQGGCNDANCRFVHACQRCFGKHGYYQCSQVKRDTVSR